MGIVRRVTNAQVKELRLWLHQGASLKMAAMKAGMDRKSARKYREPGPLPSESRRSRSWRTRRDPLAAVWPQLEEMLTREPELQAVTLLVWLQSAYPEAYPDAVRRTLERRVRIWKAQHGPAKEVFFAQVHEPGRLGASDFTHLSSLGVTIAGQPFDHLVYHFVLTHSNWEHVTVCFSESFASLSAGLQNALWALGGVPERHRTDRLTMAVHADGQAEEFTAKYQALLAHYGLTGEATNPASGHENGDCEQSHRRFKEALTQALLLRGSRDFASRADYEQFLRALVTLRNQRRQPAFAAEASALGPLPARRLETLECLRVRVGRGSTIGVRHNTYSVPARLRGEVVEVRLGVEEIEVWYAGTLVQRMPRLRGQNKHAIDYRHIIGWLVRKPGAFARYVYRADLYPTTTFRRAYDRLQAQDPERADQDYLQLLYLAAQAGESAVAAALETLLSAGARLGVGAVQARLGPEPSPTIAAQVTVAAVDLGQYDALLTATASLTDGEQPAVAVREEEVTHGRDDGEPGRGSDALLDGAARADDACRVRGGGAAGDGGDVGLCRLPAGAGPPGVPAAAGEPHRALAQRLEAAAGEELGGVGPETSAGQSGAAVARAVERRLPGPAGERPGVRPAGFGEDPLPGGGGPGVGAVRPAGAVHDLRPAGARPAGGQARLHAESIAEASGPLGRVAAGRPGLRAAEPGRDGGVVHAAGGALRAWQRAGDEQPAVLEVGADLQGPDDDSSSGGSAGAPQRDRGVEHPELPGRGGQAGEATGGVDRGVGAAVGRSGSAPVALAALGLPALRQTAPPQGYARMSWGMIIVAKGEG
jgi:transposase